MVVACMFGTHLCKHNARVTTVTRRRCWLSLLCVSVGVVSWGISVVCCLTSHVAHSPICTLLCVCIFDDGIVQGM